MWQPLWQHCVMSDNSWQTEVVWARVNNASRKNLLYMKTNRHYFQTDSRVRQNVQVPLCSPLPACFHQWPVSSLAPPRNRYSSNTQCSTFHYLVVVKRTRRLNPSKINSALDGSFNFVFNWATYAIITSNIVTGALTVSTSLSEG